MFCLRYKNFIEDTPISSQTQLSVIPLGREDDNGVRQPVGPREQEMEIKQIQQLLRAKKNPLCDLAADLIDFDPKSRPPIAEVEQRLSVLLQEPERSRILQELSAGSPTP